MTTLRRIWRRLWWSGQFLPVVAMNREQRRRDAKARRRVR